MKLHSMIIAGGAGLLLLGACSPSSYQTTFPEPAYVKVSTNNGAYAPYPDDPVGQQELVYWYNSLAAPMTVVAEVPPTPIVTTGSGPVVLDSSDFSAKLYRDRTEIKKKNINNSTTQIIACTVVPTFPGVYWSERRPLTRLPTTIPKPANTINPVMLSALKPDTFVNNGLI